MALKKGTPERNPAMLERRAGAEIVVMDPTSGEFHLLNTGAMVVWQMCDGRTTFDEMVEAIRDFSHSPRREISTHVERILAEFDAKGMLGSSS